MVSHITGEVKEWLHFNQRVKLGGIMTAEEINRRAKQENEVNRAVERKIWSKGTK